MYQKYRFDHLSYDTGTLQKLLSTCRAAPTDPGGADVALLRQPVRSAADIVAHMRAFVRLLARWPQRLRMALPVTEKGRPARRVLAHILRQETSDRADQAVGRGLQCMA